MRTLGLLKTPILEKFSGKTIEKPRPGKTFRTKSTKHDTDAVYELAMLIQPYYSLSHCILYNLLLYLRGKLVRIFFQ